MKTKLTKTVIDKAESTARDYVLWDTETTGFGVRIYPSGRKTFVLQTKIKTTGKEARHTLGRFGIVTVDEARAEARKLLSLSQLGKHPFPERLASPVTFSDAFDEWCSIPAPAHRRTGQSRNPSSVDRDRQRIRLHALPSLASKRLSDITHSDIEALKATLELKRAPAANRVGKGNYGYTGGIVTARRTLRTLKAFFAHFVECGVIPSNPALKIKLPADNIRIDYLTDEEVCDLRKAIERYRLRGVNAAALDVILLLLETGCRKNEIQQLKKVEVFLSSKEIRLLRAKNGVRTVHLSDTAVDILSRQPFTPSPYIFPGHKRPDTHIQCADDIFKTISSEIGRPTLSLHGLRHTLGSRLARTGASVPVISAALGIKSVKLLMTYAHTDGDEVRRRLNALQ